jgi:NapC/NirT cytochrome c family protein
VTHLTSLARHPLAIAGAVIATVAGTGFVALAIALFAGLFDNPYAGLVVSIVLPGALVLGLLLIPLGMWLERRKRRRHPDAPTEWPVLDFGRSSVRRAALVITALTAVNLVIVLLAGYSSLHWMESPSFCGQVCHEPMKPQFSSWSAATHARIACVGCHIGEGPSAFIHAKLAGVRQLSHVITNSYQRPTPPGAEMAPGAQAQTCRGCHRPEHQVRDRAVAIREYADDEANTETLTVLELQFGVPSRSPRSIHWHADPRVRVEYVATDDTKETIPYVKVTDANGAVKEFVAADVGEDARQRGTRRVMDCIDCHNTVGHPIAATAEQAVDRAIAAGAISRQLPHARREGVRVLKASYPSEEDAVRGIDREFRTFYQSRGGAIDEQAVTRTVAALQDVYRRNVFPEMNVTWGSYPDRRGHVSSTGCFRCHDGSHKDKGGATISGDCEYCHTQLELPAPALESALGDVSPPGSTR